MGTPHFVLSGLHQTVVEFCWLAARPLCLSVKREALGTDALCPGGSTPHSADTLEVGTNSHFGAITGLRGQQQITSPSLGESDLKAAEECLRGVFWAAEPSRRLQGAKTWRPAAPVGPVGRRPVKGRVNPLGSQNNRDVEGSDTISYFFKSLWLLRGAWSRGGERTRNVYLQSSGEE